MVTERSGSEGIAGDRAQLILIGALALAFIILGVVVVFNGVLYTETISSGSSGQAASEATVTEHEINTGIAGLAHRTNTDNELDDATQFEAELDVEAFTASYLETTANSQPAATGVEFVRVTESANVVTADADGVAGERIATAGSHTDPHRIGHLSFELEHTGAGGEITVSVDDTEGTEEEIVIEETENGFEIDGDGTCSVDVDTGEPVWIDLVSGTVGPSPDDCLDPTWIIPPEEYVVEVDREEEGIEGTLELVTKGDEDDVGPEADRDYGAWSIEVQVTYTSETTYFSRTQPVSIYEGSEVHT
ncbi:hypothetical protein [Halobiforma nitratireducens]|uniref:Uncharacterized protein n=1 Tax=Halobiforma nitratireducens JCM 10879 TaxID=1227454 RepID=M0MEV5_9EURY|nr:hypothetical protein [Halobiforma nitratireducens]EMA42940.1 hypothetical protein C446_03801 [Halobiforma nitratireducens JCM 10879]